MRPQIITPLILSALLTAATAPCSFSEERAETPCFISGIVADADSLPLPGAAVSILELPDSTYVSGTLADADGKFSISLPECDPQRYLLLASCIGYEKFCSAVSDISPQIILPAKTELLDELIVSADRSSLSISGDVFTFFPGSLAAQVGNAYRILALTPVIDWNEGNPTVYGQKAEVRVNGKKPRVGTGTALAQFLRAMNPERVNKVEIMPRGDISTLQPIINIVMNDRFHNFIGSISLSDHGRQKENSISETFQPMYSTGPLLLAATLTHGYGKSTQESTRDISYLSSGGRISATDKLCYEDTDFGVTLAASYQFANKSELGLTADISASKSFQKSKDFSLISPASLPEETEYSEDATAIPLRYPHLGVNLSYYLPTDNMNSELTAEAIWWTSNTASDRRLISAPDRNSPFEILLTQSNRLTSNGATLTLKRKRAFGPRYMLSYGLGGDTYYNGLDYYESDRTPDIFRYRQTVANAYASFWTNPVSFFYLRVGVRGEATIIDCSQQAVAYSSDRFYFHLLPDIAMQFNCPRNNSISLMSQTRLNRPMYLKMNPYLRYVTPYMATSGNTSLNPSRTSDITLQWTAFGKVFVSAGYSAERDVITTVSTITDGRLVLSSPRNIGKADNLSLGAGYYGSFLDNRLMVGAGANAIWYNYIGRYDGNCYDNHSWSYSANASVTAFISKRQMLSGSLSYSYQSAMQNALMRFGSRHGLSLSLNKDFSWGGALSLALQDIVGTRMHTVSYSADTRIESASTLIPLRFNVGFSYSFGKGEMRGRRTSQNTFGNSASATILEH